MAIIKPTKPDSELPKTWGGTQYPYTEEQIAEGLPEAIPTIIDGGTLNYEKKGVFERMEYVTQVSDAVAGAPIKKTLITNANNQFEYAGIGVYSYSATQTYALDDYVIYSTNEGTKIYKSLSNNNIGKELTNETYWEELSLGGGSGLEIGDVGFAPLGIDEMQNKRRYLNGQVISQSQFESFTKKIKEAVAVNSNLATSETNWQAEVTNSKLGQCGKFVIDDTAGTIRLPKVVNIQGLQDLALMGSIKAESLPQHTHTRGTMNITGNMGTTGSYGTNFVSGAFYNASGTNIDSANAGNANKPRINFDASRNWTGATSNASGSTYKDGAPVQQEAIQYPYFIQVATGVEESVDVTREIELNNPFSLLDYKWSEYELNNASWLLSNGAFHSGATYVAVYELLLKIHNGTETKDGVSVKLSTEDYEDTDFVINTADMTFRLPIKVKLASGNAVVGNGMAVGLTNGTQTAGMVNDGNAKLHAKTEAYGVNTGVTKSSSDISGSDITVGITTDPTKSGIETSSSGLKLYFYVGETIQDANVIAASQVLTTLADCVKKSSATDRATVIGWGMPDYNAGVSFAKNTDNTAVCDGILCVFSNLYQSPTDSAYMTINGVRLCKQFGGNSGGVYYMFFPVSKGDIYNYTTKSTSADDGYTFYPLKGVN